MASDKSRSTEKEAWAQQMLEDQLDSDDRAAIRAIMELYGYDEETATELWQQFKRDMDDESRNR